MIRTVILAALALACVASNAEARPKKHHHVSTKHLDRQSVDQAPCFIFCDFSTTQTTNKIRHKSRFRGSRAPPIGVPFASTGPSPEPGADGG